MLSFFSDCLHELNFPAPNFHWYKDDEELFIRHNLTIEATPDGSQLTILHADPTDGGTYTCTAVNTVGKFKSITSHNKWKVKQIIFNQLKGIGTSN